MASEYAWNTSHIDDTDIMQSVPAIGWELKFPLDIDLVELPSVIDNASDSVSSYLRYINNDVEFLRVILAWFADDRRTVHHEWENEKWHLIVFEVGDVVMVHSEIQSKKEKKIVAILLYQTRRPYVIISKASVGTYNCRKYGKPNGSIKRFHMEDLYLLPPAIYPTEPVDTTDLQYLNSDFAPLPHLFPQNAEAYK